MTAQDRRGEDRTWKERERTGEYRTFPQKQNSTEEKDRIVQENLMYNKIVQREKDRIVQYITIQQITGHCISREIEKYLQNIEGLHKKKIKSMNHGSKMSFNHKKQCRKFSKLLCYFKVKKQTLTNYLNRYANISEKSKPYCENI